LGLGLLARKLFHLGGWAVIAGLLFGIVTSYVVLFEDLKALNKENENPPQP